MPTILETIREYEEDILIMIAESWGIDLIFDPKYSRAEQIAGLISQVQLMKEVFSSLPEKPRRAIKALVKAKGEIPWDQFVRKFGELREMGAARRERERPDRAPVSVTESLFYKALAGRAFFETSQGLQEFAFIPEEFYKFLIPVIEQKKNDDLESVIASSVEKKLLTNDYCIDHATTILAGLRIGLSPEEISLFTPIVPFSFLINLLIETELVSDYSEINSDKVKHFLEAERGQALGQLAQAWKASRKISELDLIDSLIFESRDKGDPGFSRNYLFEIIKVLPEDNWYNIQNFCSWINQNQPDILRSGGEYDAWFIKDKTSGEYIKGFENWRRVEGEYIRMMILKPLFWLGFIDLGKIPRDSHPSVFRKSKWFDTLVSGRELKYSIIQKKDFEIDKLGKVVFDRNFARDIRYQVSRCCEWDIARSQSYIYHFSPQAFVRMEKQGLKVGQLITLITRYARKPVPRNILQALERWEKSGQEADIKKILILKVKTAAILDHLLDSNMKKYVLTRLDPITAEISAESVPFIKAALIEMGIFAEILPDV